MGFPYKNLWNYYKLFVEKSVRGSNGYNINDISYWRERMFIIGVVYGLPFSLIALIPCIIVTHRHGHLLVPVFDVLSMSSISLVVLQKRLSLNVKKAFLVLIFYMVAIMLTVTLGSFAMGSIYLLAVSVIIGLSFSKKVTYWSVFVNFLIYAGFTAVIYFKLFDTPLIGKYTIDYWIDYSCNFMYLDMILALLVCNIISGLEGAVTKEARLLKKLQDEVAEKLQWHEMLKESEGHYKSLFHQNPSPMWIFDSVTLRFLQVNDAAIKRYGYSREEFLSMTVGELGLKETIDEMLSNIVSKDQSHISPQLITQHRRKNGEQFYVDVRCSIIPFEGRDARLAIARNINAQIAHTRAIQKQNARMREIAYMQSHIVRAPLARILGLTDLITKDPFDKPDGHLLTFLDTSAKELDKVIKEIVYNTEEAFASISSEDMGD